MISTSSIEKSQMLREAEQEYKDLLRQLEEDDNVTREEIENFKKNALIHKSVLVVRRRA
jgi:demethoxyubiquinone hydroxylase (CLK1/Coq7/Cat5 family)